MNQRMPWLLCLADHLSMNGSRTSTIGSEDCLLAGHVPHDSRAGLTESTICPVLPLGSDLPLTSSRDGMSDIDNGQTRRLEYTRLSIEHRAIVHEHEVLVVIGHDVFLFIGCGWLSHFELSRGFDTTPSLTLIWKA
jgi:hypothetical protein